MPIFAICNDASNKYNRNQIVNRAHSTHGENKPIKPNRIRKEEHIEDIDNDIV